MMKGNLWQQTASTHRCGEAVIGHRADSCPLRQVKSPCNSWSLAVCCLVSSRQPPDENAAPTPTCFAEVVSDDFPVLHAHLNAVNVFWNPGQAGSQQIYLPSDRCGDGTNLNLCSPPAFFGAYSKNWPLPRSMVRGPSPTLKIIFSPRRVIV